MDGRLTDVLRSSTRTRLDESAVNPEVLRFILAAQDFCEHVERPRKGQALYQQDLARVLADLYAAGSHLPCPLGAGLPKIARGLWALTPGDLRATRTALKRCLGDDGEFWHYLSLEPPDPESEQDGPTRVSLATETMNLYATLKVDLNIWAVANESNRSALIYSWGGPLGFVEVHGWRLLRALSALHLGAIDVGEPG
jgi:hypothetical protein